MVERDWINVKPIKKGIQCLTDKMVATLNEMYPDGWILTNPFDVKNTPIAPTAAWSRGTELVGPGYPGVFWLKVNGDHIALRKNGQFVGYKCWGGASYSKIRPWTAFSQDPKVQGHIEGQKPKGM